METTPSYGSVSPPWWSDREVWIIGGGPSARSFDFGRISSSAQILAVNDAAFLRAGTVTAPPALFSLDNSWIMRRRAFLSEWPGEKYLAVPLETWPECGGIPGATYLRWSYEADVRLHRGEAGLSDDPRALCTGGNSGYAALNLAYLKRAKRINLIGYDMDPADNEQFGWWAPMFRSMRVQLEAAGVEVLNHNPASFIDAFPKVYGAGCPA